MATDIALGVALLGVVLILCSFRNVVLICGYLRKFVLI